jgi:hypothetical protein
MPAVRNIPINQGTYPWETPERKAWFEAFRGAGRELQYRQYRRNWFEYPQRQFIPEYPLLVDLEPSTLCNLRCRSSS